jgi:hypothetical protein
MGLCFTADDDEKLARGWPYLIVPVDGRKEDKTAKAAEKAWYASDPIFFTEWPRKTLHRFLHAALPMWKGGDARATAALENDAAPSADECLSGLRDRFRKGKYKGVFQYRDFVWGVEVIAGTDATLDAIVSEMEKVDQPGDSSLTRSPTNTRAAMVEAAAFLLLRASRATAKKARERMERVFAAPRDRTVEPYFATLDCVLHGREAVKRFSASFPSWSDAQSLVWLEVPTGYCAASLDFVADDPSFVREMVVTNPKLHSDGMSVRVAALGGPEVLATLRARKWPAVQMPAVLRDFGMLRSPEVVTVMASLVGKSAMKAAAINWLKGHADYTRPILEKTKSAAAKFALQQLR